MQIANELHWKFHNLDTHFDTKRKMKIIFNDCETINKIVSAEELRKRYGISGDKLLSHVCKLIQNIFKELADDITMRNIKKPLSDQCGSSVYIGQTMYQTPTCE